MSFHRLGEWLSTSHVHWSDENLDSLTFSFWPLFFERLRPYDFQFSLRERNGPDFYFWLLNWMKALFPSTTRYYISPHHENPWRQNIHITFFKSPIDKRRHKSFFLNLAHRTRWRRFLFLFIEQNGDIFNSIGYVISPYHENYLRKSRATGSLPFQ